MSILQHDLFDTKSTINNTVQKHYYITFVNQYTSKVNDSPDHAHTVMAPRRTESRIAVGARTIERPAPLDDGDILPLLVLVDVGETMTAEPTEADGTAPSTPFISVAVEASVAKPTDGPGLER